MLLEKRNPTNQWVKAKKIPLGRFGTETVCYMEMPINKEGVHISNFIAIVGMTRTGKSIVMRIIYWYISKVRPIIVIDPFGDDHKYSYYKNKIDKTLPPHTPASPVDNAVFLKYPDEDLRFGEGTDKERYEKTIVPNLNDYSDKELRAIGFPEGAAIHFRRILNEYGNFGSIRNFIYFIRDFPTSAKKSEEARKKGKKYRPNDTINSKTLESMLKWLYRIRDKKLYDFRDSTSLDIIKYLEEGKNIFLNFSRNIDLARVELARILTAIIRYMEKHPDKLAPFVFIEEADEIVPRYVSDPKERERLQPILRILTTVVLRAPKHKIGVCLSSPSLAYIHKKIVDNCYERIFGSLNETDYSEVKRISFKNETLMYLIRTIQFDRKEGLREFVYYTEKKELFKFEPFACPQRYHKEV